MHFQLSSFHLLDDFNYYSNGVFGGMPFNFHIFAVIIFAVTTINTCLDVQHIKVTNSDNVAVMIPWELLFV